MKKEEFEEFNKRIRTKGLVMSRVPTRIRDSFVKLAGEEFAEDYGMTLGFLWRNYELWNTFIENWEIKLNYIIELIEKSSNTQINEKEPESLKMMSGRTVMKGGKK